MPYKLNLHTFTFLCIIVSLYTALLTGCGSSNPSAPIGVQVTGKILKGGMPLTGDPRLPPEEPPGEVVFVTAGNSDNEAEPLKADGSFTEKGWEKGIKPGKYKLAVFHFTQGRGSDGLQGFFGNETTPIEIEIPADKVGKSHDIGIIELDTYLQKK
jgi:hypothetical protein